MEKIAEQHLSKKRRFIIGGVVASAIFIGATIAWLVVRTAKHDSLRSAIEAGDTFALRIKIALGDDLNEVVYGETPIEAAVSFGQPAAIRILLDHGIDVNAVGHAGTTPLFRAWDGASVALLLERGADVRHLDDDGYQAIHYIARNSFDGNTIRALVQHGADVNAVSAVGTSPLHESMVYGSYSVVAALVELGANTNATTPTGKTPLHYGAYTPTWGSTGGAPSLSLGIVSWPAGDKTQAIQLLVERGASIDARDDDGLTPREWAEKHSPQIHGLRKDETQRQLEEETRVIKCLRDLERHSQSHDDKSV